MLLKSIYLHGTHCIVFQMCLQGVGNFAVDMYISRYDQQASKQDAKLACREDLQFGRRSSAKKTIMSGLTSVQQLAAYQHRTSQAPT